MIKDFPADAAMGAAAYKLWDVPNDALVVEAISEAKDAGLTIRSFDDFKDAPQEQFTYGTIGWVVVQLPVGTWQCDWSTDGKTWHKTWVDRSFWPRRAEFNWLLDGKSGDTKIWERWTKIV